MSVISSTLTYSGSLGIRFGNGTITSSRIIGHDTGTGIEITGLGGYNIGGSVSISNTTIMHTAVGIRVTGANKVSVAQSNFFQNATSTIENRTTQPITAENNYWGTTDAAQIAATLFDYYDDINFGKVSYSPLLSTTSDIPVLGPGQLAVSIVDQSGTTANPMFSLALTATLPIQMLISDDSSFPEQFQWEPFTTMKEFQSDGTKYIYAKFKDTNGNDSAIAFVSPKQLLYIQKNITLSGRPIFLLVKVPSDSSIVQVRGFYRAIGETSYTEQLLQQQDNLFKLWIPAHVATSGIEYYLQAEDSNGNVRATLPNTNPSTQPFVLPVSNILQEKVQANVRNDIELPVGLTFDVPAGALNHDTNLQVVELSNLPTPPIGIITTTIGYNFTMADGTASFSKPIGIGFSYAISDVVGLDYDQLRVYYSDSNGVIKLAGGTVNTTTQTINVAVDHFTDFFIAQGSVMFPPPITQAQPGMAVTIQASVVNFVPVHNATLYYKPGGGAWKSLIMTQNGQTYEATIPASDVTTTGLSYYIQASDGSTVVTYPAMDFINSPQVITVMTPPTATNTSIATPTVTSTATVTATVTDTPTSTVTTMVTNTSIATPTVTLSHTPTATPTMVTPIITPTVTPVSTPTATPVSTPTATPVSTPTATPATATPPTGTVLPTSTTIRATVMPTAISVNVDAHIGQDYQLTGKELTLIITTGNNGPDDLVGAIVDDPLPEPAPGTTWAWTCTATGGADCGISLAGTTNGVTLIQITGTGNIRQRLGRLPMGGSVVFTVTGTLNNVQQWSNTPVLILPSGAINTQGSLPSAPTVGRFQVMLPLIQR